MKHLVVALLLLAFFACLPDRLHGGEESGTAAAFASPETFRRVFERRYDLYRALAKADENYISVSSHSDDYDIAIVERKLLSMGKGIIPFLQERAAGDEDGMLALPLIAKLRGNILLRGSVLARSSQPPPETVGGRNGMATGVGGSDFRRLLELVGAMPSNLSDDFEKHYWAWDKFVQEDPRIQISSNTHDAATGPDFEHMVAMGEAVIPLVLFRAMGNFFALQIYDRIMADKPELRVDDAGYDGEQARVGRTVRLWLSKTE